jgi:pSer/pThr/pTyr-binding forkhead associated (FHA) protein
MKVSLMVLTPGKMEGKPIRINVPQFFIGRDPQCHLRPASPLISKRHCAIDSRDDKVVVRDFGSTNGTYVNDEKVTGDQELKNDDLLKVGPLEFRLVIEEGVTAATAATPPPRVSSAASRADDAAADMLLALGDEVSATDGTVDANGIPTGSTVMDVLSPKVEDPQQQTQRTGGADREKAAKMAQGNTSTAAKAILEKYMRRPRSS